jgi:CHAT domain-containing protein
VAGKFAEARSLYDQALASCRAAGMRSEEAVVLNNLGTLALARGDVEGAVSFLRQSVQVKEQLRLTASGSTRRDFLASWISSYRKLIEAHHLAGSAAAAFDAAEMVKARTLAEQMQREPGAGGATQLDAASLQRSLPARSAVVSFANADWEYPVGICLTRDRAFVVRLAQDDPRASGHLLGETGEGGTGGFEPLVQAYRSLLARPRLTAGQAARRSELGRFLYRALLGPFEGQLEAVDDLLIIPDGSLGTLPFEALVLPDGRWVAERWNVTYLPSAQVRSLLEARGSSRAPRPLLALGGASYAARPAAEQPRVSPLQLAALRAEAGRLLEQGKPAREIYEELGFVSWQPLPGTLAEVTAIGAAVPGSVVLTGAEACERRLKELARADELAGYRVLHFATHGVLVPGVPELSAVVLAEAGRSGQSDDGYLTPAEVARLRLDADFVDLSACQTGLGKVYQGEGVVGLVQAFLVAGARSMAVSLWQVADESTRQFMVGVYRLVQERGIPYARAMTEMRRRFIGAGRWREPFYWAPFVYYGR